jgi:uncharacterized protein (DUF433 family)
VDTPLSAGLRVAVLLRRIPVVAERITFETGKRSGQACIRGWRTIVWDVLIWLAAGKSEEQIFAHNPELEKDDFRADCGYAVRAGRRVTP